MEALGIDIGGTGIKAAPVNTLTGQLLAERVRMDTPKSGKPADIAAIVQKLIQHFQWKGAVGCGFPAVVISGVAKTHGNLHKSWQDINVRELFEKKSNCSFTILNDADAAGLAIMEFGVGKGLRGKVLVVTIGTGIGSALFLDGHLISNTEFGRINSFKGEVIEQYASRSAMDREYLSQKKWAKRFDYYLHHIDSILSPDHIILGGGMSKKFDKFEKYLTVEVPVIGAQLQNDAGVIGSALASSNKD